jgi:hypothetical protein
MKNHSFLLITLILFFISASNQQTLDLTTHKTATFQAKSWKDLVGKKVECPNEGVLKNFVLKKSNNNYYYEYQCYSSVKKASDYGDAIIKFSNGVSTYRLDNKQVSSTSLNVIKDLRFRCSVDYGLKSFYFEIENNQNLVTYTYYHGVKTSYQTPVNVETQRVALNNNNINTIEAMVNVLVGRQDKETTDVIGYPLMGFIIKVESNQFYFLYSYGKLKNMAPVLDSYKAKFKQLRDNNDQKI